MNNAMDIPTNKRTRTCYESSGDRNYSVTQTPCNSVNESNSILCDPFTKPQISPVYRNSGGSGFNFSFGSGFKDSDEHLQDMQPGRLFNFSGGEQSNYRERSNGWGNPRDVWGREGEDWDWEYEDCECGVENCECVDTVEVCESCQKEWDQCDCCDSD